MLNIVKDVEPTCWHLFNTC